MKVLITGASSGIGYEFAKEYAKKGYEVIGVGRDKDKLSKLYNETGCITEVCDISVPENAKSLFEKYKDCDIVINNAGFGDVGYFCETDLEKDISMINTNVTGLHILTKLYAKEMVLRNNGSILNVASVAGFMPGPLMATYYATKAYVYRLTLAVNEEIKKLNKNVYVGVLCPGPVSTNFDKVAGVKFNLKSHSAEKIVKYTISCIEKNKKIIIPTLSVKIARIGLKFIPERLSSKIAHKIQSKKIF